MNFQSEVSQTEIMIVLAFDLDIKFHLLRRRCQINLNQCVAIFVGRKRSKSFLMFDLKLAQLKNCRIGDERKTFCVIFKHESFDEHSRGLQTFLDGNRAKRYVTC